MDESVQPDFLTCAALDAISIHAYGTGDYATSAIQTYVQRAQAAGKKLLMEEWYVASNCDMYLADASDQSAQWDKEKLVIVPWVSAHPLPTPPIEQKPKL